MMRRGIERQTASGEVTTSPMTMNCTPRTTMIAPNIRVYKLRKSDIWVITLLFLLMRLLHP